LLSTTFPPPADVRICADFSVGVELRFRLGLIVYIYRCGPSLGYNSNKKKIITLFFKHLKYNSNTLRNFTNTIYFFRSTIDKDYPLLKNCTCIEMNRRRTFESKSIVRTIFIVTQQNDIRMSFSRSKGIRNKRDFEV